MWGAVAASSLLIGAVIARIHTPHKIALGLVMGFGSGVLLSAVAFELVEVALGTADGLGSTTFGLAVGALTFYFGDVAINRFGQAIGPEDEASPMSIVLGAALDGIPESAVIGLTLLTGEVGVAMLVAVFASNLPESIAASTGLHERNWKPKRVYALWGTIVLASAVSSMAGYGFLDGASPDVIAFVLAFAGGAILTMLTTSMVPEAYEYAGRKVGLITTLGFAFAVGINWLEG